MAFVSSPSCWDWMFELFSSFSRGGRSDRYNGGGGYYQRPAGGARPASTDQDKGCQVFVSNLPWKTSWQDLKDLFRGAGDVVRADVFQRDGVSRGCGKVVYATPEEANQAIRMWCRATNNLGIVRICVLVVHGCVGLTVPVCVENVVVSSNE